MPKVQGLLLGYRWPLFQSAYKQAQFAYKHRQALQVFNVPGAAVLAVNAGELRYNPLTQVASLQRKAPQQWFENWEYEGIEFTHLPTPGNYRRVVAGELLGRVKPTGKWSLGLYRTLGRSPVLNPSRENPIDYLQFYGATFTTAPELGEASGLVTVAVVGVVAYLLVKALT